MILLLQSLNKYFFEGELKRIYLNLFLLVLFAFLDVFGLVLIGFLIVNFGNLQEAIINLLSFQSLFVLPFTSESKIFYFFCSFTIIYSIFNLFSTVYIIKKISIFSQLIGAKVKSKILNYFLNKKWSSLSESSFSENISRITNDGEEVALMINFFMLLFSRISLAFIIIISLLFFDFYLTLYFVSILTIAYFLIFYAFKARLEKNGVIVSKSMDANMQVLKNMFGSIKEINFYNTQNLVVENFTNNTLTLAKAKGSNMALALVPRFLIDSLIVLALVVGIIYFNFFTNLSSYDFIATLSVFGIACLKLLPAFQNIFYNVNEIYARIPNLLNITNLLQNSVEESIKDKQLRKDFVFNKEITFKNISFQYSDRNRFAIKNLNLFIKEGEKIALIGPSGSGKSTVIDILLRFIEPDNGELLIDDLSSEEIEINSYRKNFSYVPQRIYLFEGSLAENILFDQIIDDSNLELFKNVLSVVELKDFVEGLPEGLETYISDDNQSISGGQKQRVGIARSLFKGGEVLILDEATNSLDPVLERRIYSSIENLKNYTFLCITHRVSSLEKFDRIYLLNEGQIEDYGTFEELSNRSEIFREMIKSEKEN